MNTNETVNYGMVQMSGGWASMKYDQESATFGNSCLAHDAVDMFSMLADVALEPRSVVSANVSMSKMKHKHALEKILGTGKELNDALFATAYGLKGLGMPLLGLESNIEYLNAQKIQKFQLTNITPERIFIGGSGVENHQEFVEMVKEKLRYITPIEGRKVNEVESSEYIGGSHLNLTPENAANIILAYEAPNWNDSSVMAARLASYILGAQATTHSHNHVNCYDRIHRDLLSTKAYIESAHAFNYTFSDSGLFGLRVRGSASHVPQMYEDLTSQFQRLAEGVSEEELAMAKANMKIRILSGVEDPAYRLSETLKNLRTYGEVKHDQYLNWIDSVTAADVKSAVQAMLKTRPTLVANGGNVAVLTNIAQRH